MLITVSVCRSIQQQLLLCLDWIFRKDLNGCFYRCSTPCQSSTTGIPGWDCSNLLWFQASRHLTEELALFAPTCIDYSDSYTSNAIWLIPAMISASTNLQQTYCFICHNLCILCLIWCIRHCISTYSLVRVCLKRAHRPVHEHALPPHLHGEWKRDLSQLPCYYSWGSLCYEARTSRMNFSLQTAVLWTFDGSLLS